MSSTEKPRKQGLAALALNAAVLFAATGEDLSLEGLKSTLRSEVEKDPIDALFRFTAGAAWLFYQAEHDENPRVTTYADALVYISTSLSVGYHEIHPRTQAGQMIAAVVHALGPSLAASALRPPCEAQVPPVATNDAVVERLDAVLQELRALRLGSASAVVLAPREDGPGDSEA